MNKSLVGIIACGLLTASCTTTPGKGTAIGAGGGALLGAGIGAVIGSRDGNLGRGILIGAGAGAVAGGVAGNIIDRQAQDLAQVAETRRTNEGILVSLKSDILFDSGLSSLKGNSANQIDRIGDILAKYPDDRILVMGHTDSQGSAGYNQQLSEERANSVKAELLNRMENSNITVMGMGKSQPIASNNTAAGRTRNRRVELKITVPDGSRN